MAAATAQNAESTQDASTAQDTATAEDSVAAQDAATAQEALAAQDLELLLAQAHEELGALVRDLHAADADLAALATERKQHRLVQDACEALQALSEIGGAGLFWGEGWTAGMRDERIRHARDRVDAFQARIAEIEGRRGALLEEITQQQDRAGVLEDDLFEAQEEAERRKYEWIIEREIDAIRSRTPMMPWTRGGEDDRRFRKSLATALMVSLLFALIIPMIPLPFLTLQEKPVVPEHVVTLIPETHPVQPPPPQEMKPRPERVVEQKPVQKPLPQRTQPDKQQQPDDVAGPEQGILAFREKLAAFKEAPVVARLGSQAHINSADDSVSPTERSMLTTSAPGSSGGIKLAALSHDFGRNGGGARDAIQGGALTRASSGINAIAPAGHPLSKGPGLARTDEEIQIVFDRYKASLYRLYNRELRRDPTLQGKMILRLTIEPDGNVSFCQLQATDMNAPELSAQVVDRVKTFNFGAKEVPAITIVYPIDFLPAV